MTAKGAKGAKVTGINFQKPFRVFRPSLAVQFSSVRELLPSQIGSLDRVQKVVDQTPTLYVFEELEK